MEEAHQSDAPEHLVDPTDPSKTPKRSFFSGRYKTTEFEDGSAVMEIGDGVIKVVFVENLLPRGKRARSSASRRK